MLTIDGAHGEGGGQVLRSALALSLCTGQPFRIVNIRAARKKPGLQPQHLAAVRAAVAVAAATVEGDARDSQVLAFHPGRIVPGDFHFDIGTAGSTTLVLQTVLPALMTAREPSSLLLEGGTHNPLAPPFEFLRYAFLPLLRRLGARVGATLERPGYAPAGGGRVRVSVTPVKQLQPLTVDARGEVVGQRAEVLLSRLPAHIAERELAVLGRELGIAAAHRMIRIDDTAAGPGNAVAVIVESEQITECFTALGRRGVPAERVAGDVVAAVRHYLASGVPVGRHLADQLLVPLALAGGGRFVTMAPSRHLLTNVDIIRQFIDRAISVRQLDERRWQVCLT